ncbi:hypothetical protein C7H09_10200 [Marinobacter fuscus]|uniref:Solute-binding protein family 3/N-terminal domain-containing protein n=1 Tax=Marinobacter fuscus TaxID=2109942 RepID=A0A2T1KAU4_9GAMM|nr:hypothetical protein [Marinobacter fuscus]PSF07160.1 hypothetical protein C7H09_10200 [Marinobacter fuscus]
MKFRALIIGILLIAASGTARAHHEIISLYTFSAPPYQHSEANIPVVIGETTTTVRCAMERAGFQSKISLMPQSRARYSLERNLVDGYFAVESSPVMDAMAEPTHPVALEEWYWFYTASSLPAPEQVRIGVVRGSNEALWMEGHGLKPFISVASAEQLPALLERRRIDLALMDQRAMADLQEPGEKESVRLNSSFVRYAPLHLYVNRPFTDLHPEFLTRFNDELAHCSAPNVALSEQETARIQSVAKALAKDLSATLNLENAIAQGPESGNLTSILNKDMLWQVLAPHHPTPLADEILQLPASRTLARWQSEQASLVTEVLLTNESGAMVAMSQLSSDYWQGDENKFKNLVMETEHGPKSRTSMLISPVDYDPSTGRYQLTVSFPVPLAEPNNGLLGVLIFGLDIEQALKDETIPMPPERRIEP